MNERKERAKQWALAVLDATGEEREAARAFHYAVEFGLPSGDECAGFSTPSCGSWNCVNPKHQRWMPVREMDV